MGRIGIIRYVWQFENVRVRLFHGYWARELPQFGEAEEAG